jgi:BirA family biotin operon repressor/biotin-[acetyl-CoA-carboxylase] ligase
VADSITYHGATPEQLCVVLDVPRLEIRRAVSSTLDVAHELAANGAPAGTLVLAGEQTAGRGRSARPWSSEPGAGIWLTLIERPNDPTALDVLSIRVGLRAARVLDRYAPDRVSLKWPNDLFAGAGKVGGILLETRWRDARIDWVAIGLGINLRAPTGVPGAAALSAGSNPVDVLAELVPALRGAASARGALADGELEEYGRRDAIVGRVLREPAEGVASGLDRSGALIVRREGGEVRCRSGSVVLAEAS